jgi:phytanoyl-CoA hydroxylase
VDQQAIREYAARGYCIERGVFTPGEIAAMIDHYMAMSAEGPHPGDSAGVPRKTPQAAPDPWQQYPRLINMHGWDAHTREWMNDPRLTDRAALLIGQPPELLQTMVYFKPAGGRGQSFHQDNLYLRLTPIVAVWVALDRADEENGAMEMVPGAHLLGLLPFQKADTDISVTESETVIPSYLQRELIALDPGDAVFFGGLTIHGSMPNRSAGRFRRSFICHYKGTESYPITGPDLSAKPKVQ